jgi:hypothetical protein
MSSDSPDEESRQLISDARAVRSHVYDSIERFQEAVWAAGYRQGRNDAWPEAWNAGYDTALQAVEAAMRREQQAAPRPAPTFAPDQNQTPPGMEAGAVKPTASEVVLQIIRNNPGLLGVEIIGRAQKMHDYMKERTVRTALHRLKEDEKIANREKRWFLVEGSAA